MHFIPFIGSYDVWKAWTRIEQEGCNFIYLRHSVDPQKIVTIALLKFQNKWTMFLIKTKQKTLVTFFTARGRNNAKKTRDMVRVARNLISDIQGKVCRSVSTPWWCTGREFRHFWSILFQIKLGDFHGGKYFKRNRTAICNLGGIWKVWS